jgi:hypothetical protein
MSAKERDDCFESDGGKTVEERLAEAALREELRERGRRCGAEGRYLRVDDYDPVLRWHCRLD